MRRAKSSRLAKIAIVIPAFQAEELLEKTIKGLKVTTNYLVIVDDGSRDETYKIASKFSSRKVIVIKNILNLGVGGAMKTGIAKALKMGADIIIKMDADNQMDPKYIPILVEKILSRQVDCCKGSRWQYGINRNNIPKLRLWGNTLLTLLTRFATGYWEISDPNNGYIAWNSDILKRVDWNQVDNRYFFESSMLVQLNILKAKVTDISMEPRYLGEKSMMNEWKIIPKFVKDLLAYGTKRWWQKYFLYDMNAISIFIIFGFLLSVFGSVWGGYQWWWHATRSVSTPTGTVMIAILPLLIGLNLLIQALVLDITSGKGND